MLGRPREPRRASSGRARSWARAPLAGPPGPLGAALAEVRVVPEVWRELGTGMHSTRLDSFLGQLRWELLCGRDSGSPPMPGPLPPPPKPSTGVQLRHRLRASDAALEEDSVCCVEEEEEEAVGTGHRSIALGGPRENALDWDSGFSEVSGSTWREEELPVPQHPALPVPPARLRRQRLSTSGLPVPSVPVARVPPTRRPRPKSTPDACLEHWRGLDSEDWTAALLSRGRSRQPLVLGDNCFADLVHNWMELPEAAGEGDPEGGSRARTRPPQFLLGLSEQLRRQLSRARRAAMAGKRLSCPPRSEPELPADVSRFAALMSCRSRQPIICNDVVSYL